MTAAHTARIMDAGDAELARLRERVRVLEGALHIICDMAALQSKQTMARIAWEQTNDAIGKVVDKALNS